MRGKQGRRLLVPGVGLLAAVLLWLPGAGIAGDAPAATNVGVVMRKTAPTRQLPARRLPARPRNDALQSKLYFGSRIESVTTGVAPQNPYESNYASYLHAHRKAIIGFRLALTSRAYVFVGVGMAISDALLEQSLGRNANITAPQIQNALGMQTEYGLGWEF